MSLNISQQKKKITTISILFIIVFILIIGIIGKAFNTPSKETYSGGIAVDNISEYFNEISNDLKSELFYKIGANATMFLEDGAELPESGAKIRDDSVEKEELSGKFIVDIESIKQSFLIELGWEKDYEYVTVSCPSKKDIIYQETLCEIYASNFIPSAYWVHEYMINGILNNRDASRVMIAVENFVISEKERRSAPGEVPYDASYSITINERSFQKQSSSPDYIFSLSLDVDDGRDYYVVIRGDTKNLNHVAVFITRTDIENHSTATVFSNESDTSTLDSWIRSLSSDVEINHEAL